MLLWNSDTYAHSSSVSYYVFASMFCHVIRTCGWVIVATTFGWVILATFGWDTVACRSTLLLGPLGIIGGNNSTPADAGFDFS